MTAIRLAAIFGFLAVALGAFGAHALEKTLEAAGRTATWHTGTLYHLIHAAVLVAIAAALPEKAAPTLAAWFFAAGIVLFSGSLYLLSVTGIKKLGFITPLGGLCFLAGWALLAIRGLR